MIGLLIGLLLGKPPAASQVSQAAIVRKACHPTICRCRSFRSW